MFFWGVDVSAYMVSPTNRYHHFVVEPSAALQENKIFECLW